MHVFLLNSGNLEYLFNLILLVGHRFIQVPHFLHLYLFTLGIFFLTRLYNGDNNPNVLPTVVEGKDKLFV